MPISENEMSALREMFLEAAGSLIAAHQAHMDDCFREVQAGFVGVYERLDRLEARMGELESRMEAFEARMETLEDRMGGLEARVGAVESQVSQLVRLDALERRMAEFEARLSG